MQNVVDNILKGRKKDLYNIIYLILLKNTSVVHAKILGRPKLGSGPKTKGSTVSSIESVQQLKKL